MIEVDIGMPETLDALTAAAADILECMFFLAIEHVDDRGPRLDEPALGVEIEFRGVHRGQFRLVTGANCARGLASNFIGVLGPGELSAEQVDEVLRELTNMMCGATLSRLAPQAVFDLSSPRLIGPGEMARRSAPLRRLESGAEWLDLYWRWGDAP